MELSDSAKMADTINWIVSFFGGETIIVPGATAGEAASRAQGQHRGQVYSIVAYPFYL